MVTAALIASAIYILSSQAPQANQGVSNVPTQTSSLQGSSAEASSSTTLTSSLSLSSLSSSSATSVNITSTTSAIGYTSSSAHAGFIFSTSPDNVFMAPGLTENYVTLTVIPLPSQGAPSEETVSLAASSPTGLSVKFATDSVTLGTGVKPHVSLALSVSQTTTPGNYTIGLTGKVGQLTENSSLVVRVVQNLVFMMGNAFVPANVTIRPGSVVYWMSLDPPPGAYPGGHTVTFTTGTNAQSPTLQQYDWYSHQFNEAGQYQYHCNFHEPSMRGVVTVSGL